MVFLIVLQITAGTGEQSETTAGGKEKKKSLEDFEREDLQKICSIFRQLCRLTGLTLNKDAVNMMLLEPMYPP